MAEFLHEINADEYDAEVLSASGPVVVDFYSTECPPCEALAPKLDSIAQLFSGDIKFVKIFRQGNRELAAELGVRSSPTLLFYQDGKEVGERLTGGVLKNSIYAQLKTILSDELFAKRMAERPKSSRDVDLLIVGAGPGGLSTAIYAAQARLSTLVIDTSLPGGQVKTTHKISNYPGTGEPLTGWELAEKMHHQAKSAGAEVLAAVDVDSVSLDPGCKRALVDGELEILAKAVVLATGAEPRLLGVPGERELRGNGISYCATCDGKYYEGQEVVVIGGGNSAVEESLFLTRFASKVTIVHQFAELQANRLAQEEARSHPSIEFQLEHEPRHFRRNPENGRMCVEVENLHTGERREIESDGVFIYIGMIPSLEGIEGPLERNQHGYVITDEEMATNIPGVFAVGDLRAKKFRQASIAAGEGTIAALAAERYLESIELKCREGQGVAK